MRSRNGKLKKKRHKAPSAKKMKTTLVHTTVGNLLQPSKHIMFATNRSLARRKLHPS